jgi:hypothetical protein
MINIIQKHKYIFIPKKVPNNQKYLKLHHKYYYSEFVPGCYFKVIEYFNIDKDYYVTLEFSNNRFWFIPNNIYNISDIYELIYDKNKILSENIINSNKSYYGYEIVYWFFNKYNNKYSEFKSYIEDSGKCRLNDSCKYFITAEYKHKKFTNININLDRRTI